MLKPASLHAALTAALPELARDPERMTMVIKKGSIINTGTKALSWEYSYTLSLIVLDWSGHADAIIAPLLLWARRNQPELFDNPERRAQGIRFDAEYLTADTIDLSVELDLTERVIVRQRPGGPDGALEAEHPPEALPVGWSDKPEHWSLWFRDELLAEWDFDPRRPPGP